VDVTALAWILLGGLLMSLIALVGVVTTVLSPQRLQRLLLPLVALAAGTLLGGAFFHMIPEGLARMPPLTACTWIVAGFSLFLALEQFLSWHHSHRATGGQGRPVTLLLLLGDGLHNFIGGLSIASTFLIHPQAGVLAWCAAAAHELPQELGDFAVLVHAGWSPRRALVWNLISALTFPLGGLVAWRLAADLPLAGLVLFGAGNFLFIAASDLVPEIKSRTTLAESGLTFTWFAAGLLLLLLLARGGRPSAAG
jgi:zinc and cadmium transporter